MTDLALTIQPSVEEIAPPPAPPATPPAERMISGIDLLDYGAGGLLPHKIYLVRGGSGVGKTLLGLQYLTRGLELQDPGVLITDQKPETVIAQAHSIGFAIDESVRRGQLAILNPSGRYFELVESPADLHAIIEELADYIRDLGARRLVLDPVYTLINTAYSSHFALSLTQTLLNALEDLPVTTVMIAGDETSADVNPVLRQLEQNAFGIIDLSQDANTGGRLMRLSKLRYANNENLTAHYRILNGRGLINYRGEGEHVVDVTKPWEETAAATRSVLILGADAETVKKIQETLGIGYEIESDPDLKSGVERAKRKKPALILVTPSPSVAAIGAILDLAQNATSSIAFLSPFASRQSDKVLYLRAGADDFITEPFTPAEFRARVDALVRRSGRRLNLRDSDIGRITPEEIAMLMGVPAGETQRRAALIEVNGKKVALDSSFSERLQRNVETVAKLGEPFALYWIKGNPHDALLNRSLAKICRQEDIVCHNRGGEFVAILPGTDQNGLRAFEARLDEKLGKRVDPRRVRRGYALYRPGDAVAGFAARAIGG
jgi:KaiC/GvpD/RAD55 family RecA-like ATPase/DNA-binding response OmpR family regulator